MSKRRLMTSGLAFLMSLCMVATVNPVSVKAANVQSDMADTVVMKEAIDDPIAKADLVITTPAQLRVFAANVNSGNDYKGKTVVLGNDIIFDGTTINNFEAIGCWINSTKSFEGTFDGNGHTISGILQMNPADDRFGIFAYVGEAGLVKNLTVKDSVFSGTRNDLKSAIVGWNKGEVRNCKAINCQISCNEEGCIGCHAAGCVVSNDGIVNLCSAINVQLQGHNSVGGVVAYGSGTIMNSFSSGDIKASFDTAVGGVCGGCYGNIINSASIASISYTEKGIYKNKCYMGGITGTLGSSGSIQNSYFAGKLLTDVDDYNVYIGGLIGNAIDSSQLSSSYYAIESCELAYGKGTPQAVLVSAQSLADMKKDSFTILLNKNRSANLTWFPWSIKGVGAVPTHVSAYDIGIVSSCGTVTCSDEFTYAGKKVAFAVAPNKYYKVSSVKVKNMAGNELAVTNSNGTYYFTMPASKVNVIVAYEFSMPITDCACSISSNSFVYNGTAKTPTVKVMRGNVTLKNGTDYFVSYSDNVNAGTGKVSITGKGVYTGTKVITFKINKAKQKIATAESTYKKVDGDKAFSLGAKVTEGKGELSYKSSNTKVATVNKNGKVTVKGPGIATIKITAASTLNYNKVTKKVKVVVSPKKVQLQKVTVQSGRKMLVKWKSLSKASGYIVEYSLRKDFKNASKVTVKGQAKTSKQIKGLRTGKRYYVRVSAYKSSAGKKVTGKASNVIRTKAIKK